MPAQNNNNDRLQQEHNELHRLQQAVDEKDQEIADLQQSLEEIRNGMRTKKQPGLKRVKKAEKTEEDSRLTMSGKKYALTARLWLPDVDINLEEGSTEQNQVLLKEYIAALPTNEQEEYSKTVTIRMFQDGLEAICTQMAHRIRKEAPNLIFGNDIANLMCDDGTRKNSDVLMALNNFDSEKKCYNMSKQPVFAVIEEGRSRASRFLRHKVPMKVVRACLFGKSLLESDTKKIALHTLGMRLKIKLVTPGTMALGVVLASWAVSADSEFTPTGGSLAEKLDKTKDGWEMLNIWNAFVFANACDPDESENIDEGDDEFAQLAKEMETEISANAEGEGEEERPLTPDPSSQ